MSDPIITVEKLSKRYVIGHQRAKDDGLRHVLERAVRNPWQWLRDRRRAVANEHEEFWALKDVSFEVKQGDVLGIIGRNGAGKSTLLKILSRITEPTSGRITIDGRVASLLEVGTGFHPELTGRENVFLNGAILGMSREEIKRKFDEIVAFAEVEKFLDTPVKRYSSGMYVRLAFAVAAHLEPEILIVDEVLAVGDAAFQKKCLGKMKDVSKGGRTVLFVSHNMAAIQQLTNKCLLLQLGEIAASGETSDVVGRYFETATKSAGNVYANKDFINRIPCGREVEFEELELIHCQYKMIPSGDPINIRIKIKGNEKVSSFRFGITISQMDGMAVGNAFSHENLSIERGETSEFTLQLKDPSLAPGKYYCGLSIGTGNHKTGIRDFDIVLEVLHFEMLPASGEAGTLGTWNPNWGAICFPAPLVAKQGKSFAQ